MMCDMADCTTCQQCSTTKDDVEEGFVGVQDGTVKLCRTCRQHMRWRRAKRRKPPGTLDGDLEPVRLSEPDDSNDEEKRINPTHRP